MTMHLLGPQYTTTSSRKRKSSVKVDAAFLAQFKEYNKSMRRIGSTEMTLENYILYRQGRLKAPEPKRKPLSINYGISDHRTRYPSGDGIGAMAVKKEQTYTGTFIKGIGTLHKSNSVPITNSEDAIAIARMRRS